MQPPTSHEETHWVICLYIMTTTLVHYLSFLKGTCYLPLLIGKSSPSPFFTQLGCWQQQPAGCCRLVANTPRTLPTEYGIPRAGSGGWVRLADCECVTPGTLSGEGCHPEDCGPVTTATGSVGVHPGNWTCDPRWRVWEGVTLDTGNVRSQVEGLRGGDTLESV